MVNRATKDSINMAKGALSNIASPKSSMKKGSVKSRQSFAASAGSSGSNKSKSFAVEEVKGPEGLQVEFEPVQEVRKMF